MGGRRGGAGKGHRRGKGGGARDNRKVGMEMRGKLVN
jgi:hypothetical protein